MSRSNESSWVDSGDRSVQDSGNFSDETHDSTERDDDPGNSDQESR